VLVSGLSASERSALLGARFDEAAWESLLRVAVTPPSAGTETPAVKGRYDVTDHGVVFTPAFPFDAGRSYYASFDPSKMPRPRASGVVTVALALSPDVSSPATHVVAMYPDADVLPENLLRVYIEFSAPMGSSSARDFVHLIDRTGSEETIVDAAFLPVEADFWSPDHRRYTLFLDPGRVKQGILPNRQSGRALRAGREYVLEIDSAWPDANRQPLTTTYRHRFRAGPAVAGPITLADWKVVPPHAGTRDRLVVTFPRPLDHAVTVRALGVERGPGVAVTGAGGVEAGDTQWTFAPGEPWTGGSYALTARSFLEDPQGNQIDAPFEEVADRPRPEEATEIFRVPFSVDR
jgi:hypothetical protein